MTARAGQRYTHNLRLVRMCLRQQIGEGTLQVVQERPCVKSSRFEHTHIQRHGDDSV